ncbi:hypothetical protein H4R35_002065 [Dimargaris xerosporica]|nr:hypothetical protein H4R35_002065 [Dimargaris xerosporica]
MLLTIKVYIIFNMLEVFNWLCLAFWQGILDTLLSKDSFFSHDAYNYVQPASASPGAATTRLQWRNLVQLGFYMIITVV